MVSLSLQRHTWLSIATPLATIHVRMPGDWTVQQENDHFERIEGDLRAAVPQVRVTTNLEPRDDPFPLADAGPDRT